jgi:acetylornithine deacetylase ArgE
LEPSGALPCGGRGNGFLFIKDGLMVLDVVDTLCELVSIPSVNPMGRPVSGPQYFEYAMTDRLQRLFEELGLPWERHEVAPKRSNIVARIEGTTPLDDGGQLLLLEAHQDTVPVDGMTIAPWRPEKRNGRIYGRGSCDIKGGMACMLSALSRLAKERPRGMPTIVMACTVNEEHGFTGATELTKSWAQGKSKLLPRAPDFAIVAEPTLLNVVVAHKGVVRWRCHTSGRATHSSQPHLGDNAIYHMSRVVGALEQYANNIVATLGKHRLVGSPTLSVGTITGGISVNTVPDLCTIEIDRRVIPGEDPLTAYQHVLQYVAENTPAGTPIMHDEPFITTRGLNDDKNGQLAERLGAVIRASGGDGKQIGVPYGTDAAAFAAVGVPAVVFGPGSIDQAHTADEWVEIEQLKTATEILYQFARTGLD